MSTRVHVVCGSVDMTRIVGKLAVVLLTLVTAAFFGLGISLTFSASSDDMLSASFLVPFAVALVLGTVWIVFRARSAQHAFARLSLIWAVLWFLTPAIVVTYSFVFAAVQMTDDLSELEAAVVAIGSLIGGATFVILAFRVGVPAGLASAVITYFAYRSERSSRIEAAGE